MKLVPLGVNGYLPINGRHSSCFLALYDDAAFVLDAGTGAARLHQPEIAALLSRYREVHLLLSHYHVDHTVGLYYAFTALRDREFHVHAPVCPYIQADPEEAIRRYFAPPLNSYELKDSTIQVHALNKPVHEIGGHRIGVWSQQHPGGSVGLRIDDDLVYATDTVVMMENVSRARGVSLLLHELWLNDADASAQDKERNRHACFTPVAEFVLAAAPGAVMPIHLYPHYQDAELHAMTDQLARVSGVVALFPEEGAVYEIAAGKAIRVSA